MSGVVKDEELHEVTVNCVIENRRRVQVYSEGDKQNLFCVHGVAFIRSCDECEDYLETLND